jgi:FKBP-type peptidyl-prolyl cis-trans isomerase FkpA
MKRLPLLSLCLLLSSAACDTASGDPADATYAPVLGVDLDAMNRGASGLYTQDLQVGTGLEATPGRKVEVNYSGWLPDSTLIDSSLNPGRTPFSFTLGRGVVIQGWEEGIVGMKKGGKRRLILPSSLGYGTRGSGAVPPNAVLIFDVELLDVR